MFSYKLPRPTASLSKAIGNRYQILRELGHGGMAHVFLAEDLKTKRQVALKKLDKKFEDDPFMRANFEKEVLALTSCRHPNIVSVYDHGIDQDNLPFYAMEYLSNGSLADLLKQKNCLPLNDLLDIALQIIDCLEHIHNLGYVHRDIKPTSILFVKQGLLKITDFGIVKKVNEVNPFKKMGHQILTGLSDHNQDTQPRVIIGTPLYISPEQVKFERIDQRTDLYSLGVLMFESLTGAYPYVAETPYALCMQHVHAPIPNPREQNATIPEDIAAIIMKLMAKAPWDRYASARAVKAQLITAILNNHLDTDPRLAGHVACYTLESHTHPGQ